MRHRSIDNPVPRNLGFEASRKLAVETILERLHAPEAETEARRVLGALERRQRLQDQPWRRPRRPGAEGASTMELIRRFEARQKPH
jgi:hypothetical protein